MDASRLIVALALFGVAVFAAIRTLSAGAGEPGRYRSIGFVAALAAFGAALWAALGVLG